MIREDNFSDTNKLYLILHEAGSLCSQGSKEQQNAADGRKLLQGKEGIRKRQIAEEQGMGKYGAQSWLGTWDWLSGYTVFLAKRNIYREMKMICSLVCPCGILGRRASVLSLVM